MGDLSVCMLPEGKVETTFPLTEGTARTKRFSSVRAFSQNSKCLVAAASDNTVPWNGFYLWDLNSLKTLNVVETQHGGCREVRFGQNDKSLAVLNTDNTITIWDLETLISHSTK